MTKPVEYSVAGLAVRRLQPEIGAEIADVDFREEQSADRKAALCQALNDHGVLVFRDQDISRDDYIRFAHIFARREDEPFVQWDDQPEPVDGYPELLTVISEFKDGKVFAAADVWHTDDVMSTNPTAITVLRSYYVPTIGGDTVFSSAVAAYEGLDGETKEVIEDLRIVFARHLSEDRKESKNYKPSLFTAPPVAHPVVQIHPETGQRLLFVNETATGPFVGREGPEWDALRERLAREFTKPEYQCRIAWQPNSIVIWDNALVQHRAVADYSEPRYLERMTLTAAEQPHNASGMRSERWHAEPA